MSSGEVLPARAGYSKLLRIVAGVLFLGAVFTVPGVFTEVAKSLGLTYQVALIVAGVVTATAAVGIWRHKKWGAWTYIGWTILNQPFMFFMGWWVVGSVILPSVLIVLIVLKFKWLS